ncbi:MAG: hypothetical protein ABI642_18470, partial [Polaromonas sp.]
MQKGPAGKAVLTQNDHGNCCKCRSLASGRDSTWSYRAWRLPAPQDGFGSQAGKGVIPVTQPGRVLPQCKASPPEPYFMHDHNLTFDYIIIGAGTAGCLLANR